MAFKHELIDELVTSALPGDRVVSYAVTQLGNVGGPSPGSHSSPEFGGTLRIQLAQRLGLDKSQNLLSPSATFLLLTDRHIALGSRSGVRNRPKELVHSAPLDGAHVHWFDHDAGAGTVLRHFVTVFGDGRWRGDQSGLTAMGREVSSNAEHFVAALGDRATEVTDL